MKFALLVLAIVVVIYFFSTSKIAKVGGGLPACPPGYYDPGTFSTWAGWEYNCLPIGQTSTLVGLPHDTYARPLTTIYKPIVEGTGAWPKCGEPADAVYQRR